MNNKRNEVGLRAGQAVARKELRAGKGFGYARSVGALSAVEIPPVVILDGVAVRIEIEPAAQMREQFENAIPVFGAITSWLASKFPRFSTQMPC